jgi:hypothetical protein
MKIIPTIENLTPVSLQSADVGSAKLGDKLGTNYVCNFSKLAIVISLNRATGRNQWLDRLGFRLRISRCGVQIQGWPVTDNLSRVETDVKLGFSLWLF